MQPGVDIIVVGYNLPILEERCLKCIRNFTEYPYVLTFRDNYKTGLTLTQMWNTLIRKSRKEYVCLLNNDTEVCPGWLTKMMQTVLTIPDCGFVGPSTNACHSPQKMISSYEMAKLYKGQYEKMEQPISGFCLLFRKATWEKLGGFDERYALYGQESDFIDRAKKLGLHCYWRKDAFVHHVGEASIKSSGVNVEEERNKAKKLYWSTRKKPK